MEYRALEDGSIELFGYCNITNRDSKVLSEKGIRFKEQIVQGTWQRAIQRNNDIKLLKNHSWDKIYDSTANNLTLYEDRIGARFSIRTNDEEFKRLAINNEFKGLSFAFMCKRDEYEDIGNGLKRRYVRDMDVSEISLLTVPPAYDGSFVEMRDLQGNQLEIRYIESLDLSVVEERQDEIIEETGSHTHVVSIPNHTHEITLPDHIHSIRHEINELSTLPSSVKIKVDYSLYERQIEYLRLKS